LENVVGWGLRKKFEAKTLWQNGRPTKEPTADDKAKVKELLAKSVPIEDIAKLVGLSKPTFRKYFQTEIFAGKKLLALLSPQGDGG
jgi:DNA invertase Pin-like site-specific DNA recombinase